MKNLAIGCGVVAILGVLVIGMAGAWLLRELPVLNASITSEPIVQLDEEFTLTVNAANAEEAPIVLDSIDIDDTFLDGFQVVDVQPAPSDTSHFMGMRSWYFERSVAPGDTLQVQFTLRAVQEGHFSGDVGVCNPNQDVSTVVADVMVRKSR